MPRRAGPIKEIARNPASLMLSPDSKLRERGLYRPCPRASANSSANVRAGAGWDQREPDQRFDGKLNTAPSRTPADGQRCVIVLRLV